MVSMSVRNPQQAGENGMVQVGSVQADLALVGLGPMGSNLVQNFLRHNYSVAFFDLDSSKVKSVAQEVATFVCANKAFASYSLQALCDKLKSPKKVFAMIPAGKAVDDLIALLVDILRPDDIIIDGGNSKYEDTEKRASFLREKKILFIGCGISGGSKGALHGPSLMPGGEVSAWPQVQPFLQAIAARTSGEEVCCEWIGSGGAGHYVKMVHNAIEYGLLQLIAEAYFFLKNGHYSSIEMQALLTKWNQGILNSYLIDITAKILQLRAADGNLVLDDVLDVADQKGTGIWALEQSCRLGVSTPLFAVAVYERVLSTKKTERVAFAQMFSEQEHSKLDPSFENKLEHALHLGFLTSYAQGFALIEAASEEFNGLLQRAKIAKIWREGCIIRSAFLDQISQALEKGCTHLFSDLTLSKMVIEELDCLKDVLQEGIKRGISLPGFCSVLSYIESFRSSNLPTDLIQAQRDCFGEHGYESRKEYEALSASEQSDSKRRRKLHRTKWE